ncbi:MAG: dTMP kinase [Patescibacteria group bacterium]|nr:dTMP kinase [Patescibacteria group bacterium]MBU1952928.1 dTMP kinase [Patescibacteria group bacterium]
MYIVFEGIVGTGKTTLSKKLYDYLKEKYPRKEVVWTREPGGTEIAQKIRECVQGTNFNEDMDPICEAYLYAASRAQSLRTIVKPIIEKGGIAIADRSFITSMANQGYGRELGVKRALKINEPAVEGIHPDLVVFLDVDPKIAITRVYDGSGDKFERFGIDFYRKLHSGYKKISKMKMFKNKWVNVKVEKDSIEKNFKLILKAVKPYLP